MVGFFKIWPLTRMKIWPIEFFAQVGSKLCLLLNKFSKMGKYFNISPNLVILLTSIHPHEVIINVLNGLFTASFPLFSSFQYSWQLTNVRYKRWLMTGFEPRTSGVGSDCSTNWATIAEGYSCTNHCVWCTWLMSVVCVQSLTDCARYR